MFSVSTSVRPTAVAGMFYPDNPNQLRQMVREYLKRAPQHDLQPRAMVAPHAGYIYSGYTAACAYKTLKPSKVRQRVFLAGPSHRVYLEGISVGNFSAFKTPLGQVALDQEILQRLFREEPDITRQPEAHQQEHSLEVHLPFLQETLGDFILVPMVFGKITPERLAEILYKYAEKDDLIIVSSDLSHYYSEEQARQLDQQCHDAMLKQDASAMATCKACGNIGMSALLNLAKRHHWQSKLIDYRTSYDYSKDASRVVGYASYLFVGDQSMNKQDLPAKAREHLRQVLAGQPGLDHTTLTDAMPELAEKGACFVTLTKGGVLRGCIGSLEAHRSLAEDLLANTVAAALKDSRFPAMSSNELDRVSIEVSLLTAAEPLEYVDPSDLLTRLKPNVHGVILELNGKRATFLPQVWEQLPDPKIFLEHLCRKAGLALDCRKESPKIYVYTVDKYLEE
ncbi:AmmeMemoRadiSam system protein B [Magnetococcales bacterium HHB-1]